MAHTLDKTRKASTKNLNGKKNGSGASSSATIARDLLLTNSTGTPIESPRHNLERNPGTLLDLDWLYSTRINQSAVERRAATLATRRTVKKEWQAAWLLRAITCLDLTTLSGDDTPGNVIRLCAKARRPVREDILEALGADNLGITVGAVCVYHNLVGVAVEASAKARTSL